MTPFPPLRVSRPLAQCVCLMGIAASWAFLLPRLCLEITALFFFYGLSSIKIIRLHNLTYNEATHLN
jgi:hypothetical protein